MSFEEISGTHGDRGIRVRLAASLAGALLRFHVDVGFGDVVTPAPEGIDFPTLLDLPAPRLRAYPIESVVSEKYQAMVDLGIANTRMKDFYDLWHMAGHFIFRGDSLREAIKATFDRRATEIPAATPVPLTSEFHEDPAKQAQWRALTSRARLVHQDLGVVAALLEEFLMPPSEAARAGRAFHAAWEPPGPWERS